VIRHLLMMKDLNYYSIGLRLRVLTGLTVLMLGMPWSAPLAAPAMTAAEKPASVVHHFHTALLSVMKHANQLGYQGRYSALDSTVRNAYDFPLVARLSIGHSWRNLSADQRRQFIGVFSRLVIATYASRFDGYSGETFKYVSEQALSHKRIVIHTLLSRPDDDAVQLDYVLRQSHGQWRVINVIADGVSDLALKRADYTTELKRNGFGALVNRLKEKIGQYE